MCPLGNVHDERGPQHWRMLAPRNKKRVTIDRTRGALGWGLWSKLARPETTRSSRNSCRPRAGPFPLTGTLACIEFLPAELIAMILEDSVLANEDIIALGCSSPVLWPYVLAHIDDNKRLEAAPLAGLEVACVGSYLTTLPQSFNVDDLAMSTVKMIPGGCNLCDAINFHKRARIEYANIEKKTDPQQWKKLSKA
ncbi:hypothetical protein EJ08DRAFT_51569 [Tothia fuscella]|uniref:Uncharacterized protein n=1 Tax=Tothia fuscella TaxID=1048955 RepID=A0A9P4NF33_9PEZI|nr:hypothetical protein EJ08DRAFT_51569 [Tothia fuscella]